MGAHSAGAGAGAQVEYRDVVEAMSAGKLRLSLPFTELEMWRYVFTGAAPSKGPQREWGEELHPERDMGSRQVGSHHAFFTLPAFTVALRSGATVL